MGESDNEEANDFSGGNVADGQFGRLRIVSVAVESRDELRPVSSGGHLHRSLRGNLHDELLCRAGRRLRSVLRGTGRHDTRSRNIHPRPDPIIACRKVAQQTRGAAKADDDFRVPLTAGSRFPSGNVPAEAPIGNHQNETQPPFGFPPQPFPPVLRVPS